MRRSSLKSVSIFPVPTTTDPSGSSAMATGSRERKKTPSEQALRDTEEPSADVHHHVSRGFGNRKPCTDGRHHRLFHQKDFTRLGAIRRVDHRPLFHLRDLTRNADHNAR